MRPMVLGAALLILAGCNGTSASRWDAPSGEFDFAKFESDAKIAVNGLLIIADGLARAGAIPLEAEPIIAQVRVAAPLAWDVAEKAWAVRDTGGAFLAIVPIMNDVAQAYVLLGKAAP